MKRAILKIMAAVMLACNVVRGQPTNNPTGATFGLVVDASGNLVAPTNFWSQNASNINAVVTAGTATNVAATNITGTIPTNNLPAPVVVGLTSSSADIVVTPSTNSHGQSFSIAPSGYAFGSTNGNFVSENTGGNVATVTIRGDINGGRTGTITVTPGTFQWGYQGSAFFEDTSGALTTPSGATFNGNATVSAGHTFIGDGSGLTNLANGSLPSLTPAQIIVGSASSNAVAVTVSGDDTISTGGVVTHVNSAAARAHMGVPGIGDTNHLTGTNTFDLLFNAGGQIPEFLSNSGTPVGSVTGSTGWVYLDTATTNYYLYNGAPGGNTAWWRVMRTNDSGAGLTSLNATQLTSGTVPNGAFPATLPAIGGVNITGLNATQLTSGTIPSAAFPNPLPVLSGANLTSLNGSSIASGTVADARLSANVALLNTSKTDSAPTNTITGTQNFSGQVNMTGGVAMTGTSLTVGTETLTNLLFVDLHQATNPIAAYWSNSVGGYHTDISSNASIDSHGLNFHFGTANTNLGNTNVAGIGYGITTGTNTNSDFVAISSTFTNDNAVAALTVGVTLPNKTNEVFVGVTGASAEFTNNKIIFTGTQTGLSGSGAGLTSLTAGNISGQVPFANGGSAASTQAGFITAAFGMTNFTETGNPPTAPTNVPTGSYTPQLSLTTGANGKWLRFWDGAAWKSLFIIGTNAPEFFVADNNVYFWATNGVDNCIELRNYDPAHYSAARFMDNGGTEQGAVGWGNSNSGYANMNYLETFGLLHPFYFVAGGGVIGGCAKTSGDFIWMDATGTNTIFWIKRGTLATSTLNFTNELNVGGIIRAGTGAADGTTNSGSQVTTVSGKLNIGDFDNSQTGTAAMDSANVHGSNFTANVRTTYAGGPISFDGGGNGSGLNYQTTGGAVGMYFGLGGTLNGMWTGPNQLWDATFGSTDIGSDVQTAANDGAAMLKVHGSFGTDVKTKSAAYQVTMGDSLILQGASGILTNTLSDATAHETGRIYTFKNVSTTNAQINGMGTFTFTVSGITTIPVPAATYSQNGTLFTVTATNGLSGSAPTISGTIVATGNGIPSASGTLTKVSGTGDATITDSAFSGSLQTIDGKVAYTNAPNGTLTLQCDGAGWQIIAKYLGSPTNTAAGAATGITNTWNWPATAYVLGTAITYTNFNNAGIAVFTNTTLVNDSQSIHLQEGGSIRAASGLTITMVANGN